MLMALLKRDLLLAFRSRGDLLNPLMFFMMVASLFPLAVSPDPQFLGTIAAGVIWVGALLATLLSLDLMFKSDYEDGSLEQMLLMPQPAMLMVLESAGALVSGGTALGTYSSLIRVNAGSTQWGIHAVSS